jgi:hypothetical protein
MSGYLKKYAAKFAALKVIQIFINFVATFLGVKKRDSVWEIVKKFLNILFYGSAYSATDWYLAGLTASIVASLRYFNKPFWLIFAVLWGMNLAISYLIILFSKKSGRDFTLMERLRKATESLHKESRAMGWIFELLAGFKFIFWDGPDRFVLYFESRLPSKISKILVFVVTSGIQMFIWAWLYILGYDSISDLLRAYIR